MCFILTVALLGLLADPAAGATLVVPDSFGTVGAALGVALPGDTVLVRPGTYPEHVLMVDGVVLRGDDPLNRPVLDGTFTGTPLTANACGGGTRVEDLVIANGVSPGLGGGAALTNADLTFIGCDFLDNTAHLGGGLGAVASWFAVHHCRFAGNLATQSGGAIAMTDASSPSIAITTFTNNAAFAGGAIAVRNGSAPSITGCLIDGGTADQGAAVWYDFLSGGSLTQCTIVHGQATGDNGGVLALMSLASPAIERNVLAFGGAGGVTFAAGGAGATFGCNCVFGNVGGDALEGGVDLGTNVFVDPRFCDATGGDYRVSDASPCLLDSTCALIGAFDLGCTAVPVAEPLPVESWGRIKSRWR